jgi:hypothetical protein
LRDVCRNGGGTAVFYYISQYRPIRRRVMINPCLQVIPKRQRRQPVHVEQHSSAPELAEQPRQALLRKEQAQEDVAPEQEPPGDF